MVAPLPEVVEEYNHLLLVLLTKVEVVWYQTTRHFARASSTQAHSCCSPHLLATYAYLWALYTTAATPAGAYMYTLIPIDEAAGHGVRAGGTSQHTMTASLPLRG